MSSVAISVQGSSFLVSLLSLRSVRSVKFVRSLREIESAIAVQCPLSAVLTSSPAMALGGGAAELWSAEDMEQVAAGDPCPLS